MSNTALIPLSHQGVISVIGPDAGKFLQGQVTCDVNELTDISHLGMHCNHKGRALFSFRAIQLADDHIALRLPRTMLETAQQALGKYIVFSKAELQDSSEQYHGLGISGDKAASLLATHLAPPPETAGGVVRLDSGCIVKLGAERYEIWLQADRAKQLSQDLSAEAPEAPEALWTLQDIREGLGDVFPTSSELFIPQMLNYQALRGISFEKGCYTGQEIVARMQYLGKLKRQMYRVSTNVPAEDLQPGDDIYSDAGTQSVGHIVSAASTSDMNDSAPTEALAVLTKEVAEADNAYLDKDNTQKLTRLSLPYTIAETEKDA